jgi:glycosyltransferase involved in cell wall biosynthesis
VIVVVDGSIDGTTELLAQKRFPFTFRYLTVPNGGASKARNAGVAVARGDYIALTEDDVVPDDYWLLNARRMLEENSIDVLEGKTVYSGTGGAIRKMDAKGIPSFIPCNLFVKRSVYEYLGGYDPEYYDPATHLYFREDADFGFRIIEGDYRVELASDVVVAHPKQFSNLRLCIRHARRYQFDPLLYKKHPLLYRKMIEVKNIAGFRVYRPQHLVAWISVLALLTLLLGGVRGEAPLAIWGALWVAGCGQLFRVKYQGIRSLRLYDVGETVGFLVLPLIYFGAVLKGCWKYRVLGPLV